MEIQLTEHTFGHLKLILKYQEISMLLIGYP